MSRRGLRVLFSAVVALTVVSGCASDLETVDTPAPEVTAEVTPSISDEEDPTSPPDEASADEAPIAEDSNDGGSFDEALPVEVEFKDPEGWTWRVSIEELPSVAATVDVANSPPGKAELTLTKVGTAQFSQFTNMDEGRTPPQGKTYSETPNSVSTEYSLNDIKESSHFDFGRVLGSPCKGFYNGADQWYDCSYNYDDSGETDVFTVTMPEEAANDLASQVFVSTNATASVYVDANCYLRIQSNGKVKAKPVGVDASVCRLIK